MGQIKLFSMQKKKKDAQDKKKMATTINKPNKKISPN